jgi:hypothetical protein
MVGRQVFRLTVRNDVKRLPALRSGKLFDRLTDYGGGPATDSHRLPSSSPTNNVGKPVDEDSKVWV